MAYPVSQISNLSPYNFYNLSEQKQAVKPKTNPDSPPHEFETGGWIKLSTDVEQRVASDAVTVNIPLDNESNNFRKTCIRLAFSQISSSRRSLNFLETLKNAGDLHLAWIEGDYFEFRLKIGRVHHKIKSISASIEKDRYGYPKVEREDSAITARIYWKVELEALEEFQTFGQERIDGLIFREDHALYTQHRAPSFDTNRAAALELMVYITSMKLPFLRESDKIWRDTDTVNNLSQEKGRISYTMTGYKAIIRAKNISSRWKEKDQCLALDLTAFKVQAYSIEAIEISKGMAQKSKSEDLDLVNYSEYLSHQLMGLGTTGSGWAPSIKGAKHMEFYYQMKLLPLRDLDDLTVLLRAQQIEKEEFVQFLKEQISFNCEEAERHFKFFSNLRQERGVWMNDEHTTMLKSWNRTKQAVTLIPRYLSALVCQDPNWNCYVMKAKIGSSFKQDLKDYHRSFINDVSVEEYREYIEMIRYHVDSILKVLNEANTQHTWYLEFNRRSRAPFEDWQTTLQKKTSTMGKRLMDVIDSVQAYLATNDKGTNHLEEVVELIKGDKGKNEIILQRLH